MAHYSTYTMSGDDAPAAMEAAERAREAHRNAPSTPPTVQTNRKVQVDIAANGAVTTRDLGNRQAQLDIQVRPGNIIIPGIGETSIEAARLAGLLPPGFEQPVGGMTKPAPAGAPQAAPQQQQEQQPAKAAGAADATDTAEATIGALVGKIGGEAVETGIWQVAETGDLDSIPEGVDEKQVSSIVEGFVLQANNVLKAAGAGSVGMLNETLTDAELRDARMATITNDAEKLAHFGKMALGRMEAMPYQSPDAFADLIADMPAAERKALVFNEDRKEWTVKLPGRDAMSFGQAVRAGIVRVG